LIVSIGVQKQTSTAFFFKKAFLFASLCKYPAIPANCLLVPPITQPHYSKNDNHVVLEDLKK
jgi:hypothetical protein